MKRIISTLLSLSLVLSLLPAVALAEGEEATKWLEIPGNSEVLVDESELLYAIDLRMILSLRWKRRQTMI